MRILAVDDGSVSRHAIQSELETGGYTVECCENGEDAIDAVLANPPDLITLDLTMPGIDGFETCKRIHDALHYRQLAGGEQIVVPVVFVSRSDSEEDRLRGFHVGALDFVNKPFEKGELLGVVDGILKQDRIFEGIHALLVDDSKLLRRIIQQMLNAVGMVVTCAKNGEDAFNLLKNGGADIQLVITDVEMPELNGDLFCRRVRNDLGLVELPIVLMSASDDPDLAGRVFDAGASEFIAKPFLKEEFLGRIKAQLEPYLRMREMQVELEQLRGGRSAEAS